MRRWIILIFVLFLILPINATTKRALLVGISEYPINTSVKDATWANIHGANDVFIIEKTLKLQGFKTISLTNSNASASKIRKALRQIQNETNAGDIVYLHFSCHGQPVEDQNGDEEDGWDEAIIPYDAWKIPIKGVYIGENHILDDELNVVIGNIREKVGINGYVYVVIDACHSGGMDRGEEEDEATFLRGTESGFSLTNKRYVPRIDSRSNIPIEAVAGWANVCTLEACRSYQSNYEIKEDGNFYGPLSFYINKTFQKHQLSFNTSWVEFVKKQMNENPRLSKQNMVTQTINQ